MDGHAIHLMINHFPVILSLLGLAATIVAFITRRRSVLLYALATLTLSGASAYPAYLSGGEAEEVIEDRWYVDRQQLHEHEEASEFATVLLVVTGVAAAAAWWLTLRTVREVTPGVPLLAGMLLLSVLCAASMARTSWLGGFVAIKNPALINSVAPPK
jgi:uncharacterized membrane protein